MSWREIKHLFKKCPVLLHCFNSSCSVSSGDIFLKWVFVLLLCFSFLLLLVFFFPLPRLLDCISNLDYFLSWTWPFPTEAEQSQVYLKENGIWRLRDKEKHNQKGRRSSTFPLCQKWRMRAEVVGHWWMCKLWREPPRTGAALCSILSSPRYQVTWSRELRSFPAQLCICWVPLAS